MTDTVRTVRLAYNKEIDRLKWLRVRLGISDAQSTALARIQDYLLAAELREPDVWRQQDIRLASLMVAMAEQGKRPNYEKVFQDLYGKHPQFVVDWWRDRRKLWQIAEFCDRPTPLLCANRLREVFNTVPDYDYSLEWDGRKRPRQEAEAA